MRKFTQDEIDALKAGDKEREARLREEMGEELDLAIAEQLTVRERLMRRRHRKRIQTVFEDDVGDIVIETRMFAPQERTRALTSVKKLDSVDQDPMLYDEAIRELRELCKEIDETLGDDFWDSPDATDDVVMALIINNLYGGVQMVGDGLKGFRKVPGRTVPPGSVDSSEVEPSPDG